MFALILICVLLLMLIYGQQRTIHVKEDYSNSGPQSGTFDGFMEYNNMYYIVFYSDNDDRSSLVNKGPLPGHYIKLPYLNPNGTYEIAQREGSYTEMVGQNFRALPILRAGGISLTGDDIMTIRKNIADMSTVKSYTWSYVGRDMRSVPVSLFKPDDPYNQYFQDKIYRLFDNA